MKSIEVAGADCQPDPHATADIRTVYARRLGLNYDPRRIAERCLQDAMAEALPSYWSSRALDFDLVHPDELPLLLTATPEQIEAASAAAQTALACRRHAWLLRKDGVPAYIGDEIRDVLQEVS